MAAIQTISGTLVQPAGGNTVPASQAAFFNGSSLAASAQVLESAVNFASKVYAMRQNHIEAGIQASLDTERRRTAAQIGDYMAQNQDKPETWQKYSDDAWNAHMASVDKQAKSWRPGFADRQKLEAQQAVETYRLQVGTETNKALIRSANAKLDANAELRLEHGDLEGAIKLYETMDLPPEQKAQKVRDAKQTADRFAVLSDISADPIAAYAKVQDVNNYPNLTPVRRAALAREARVAYNQRQTENFQGLIGRADSGDIPSEQELSALVKSGAIDPQHKRSVERFAKQEDFSNAKTIKAYVDDMILDYDIHDADASEQKKDIMAKIGALPPDMQSVLKRRLDAKEKGQIKPIHDFGFSQLASDFHAGYFLPGEKVEVKTDQNVDGFWGFFGRKKRVTQVQHLQEKQRRDWKNAAPIDIRSEASARYAAARSQLEQFFEENPKATYEQVDEFRKKLSAPYISGEVRKLILSPQGNKSSNPLMRK